MARRPVYLLIFLMLSPRLELWTLADYTSLVFSYSINLDTHVLGKHDITTKIQSENFSQLQRGKRNSNKYTSRLARAGRGRQIRRMAKQLCIATLLVAIRCHRHLNEKSATTQSACPLPIVLQTTKNQK